MCMRAWCILCQGSICEICTWSHIYVTHTIPSWDVSMSFICIISMYLLTLRGCITTSKHMKFTKFSVCLFWIMDYYSQEIMGYNDGWNVCIQYYQNIVILNLNIWLDKRHIHSHSIQKLVNRLSLFLEFFTDFLRLRVLIVFFRFYDNLK